MALAGPARALTFDYTFTAGTSQQAKDAFVAAGNLWSALLFDPVTVRLTVGTAALGSGILGQAASNEVQFDYGTFRSALTADAQGGVDAAAAASLRSGSIAMLINRTAQNGNTATLYLDADGSANNTVVSLTSANALALGLPASYGGVGACSTDCDGFIQFSTAFTWDYDSSNGIAGGSFDFVGIAAHEIGHALGFVSGVDVLDSNPGFEEDVYTVVKPLDLYRYSAASFAQGAIDFSASTTAKYFSLDGGATGTAVTFATGVRFGDGRQASHWKDGLGLGIMDPTSAAGELLAIGANDRTAMNVIGWDVSAVPEPGRAPLLVLGLLVLAIAWRRGSQPRR